MNTHGAGLVWFSLIGGALLTIPHFGWLSVLLSLGFVVIGIRLFDMADRGDPPFNF